MYEPLTHEIDITRMQPPTVNDFEEFIELGRIENGNFNKARLELLDAFSFRFVTLTSENGIARWEQMLKLRPRAGDALESRRMKVLAKINNKLPYTWRTLHKMLGALLGEGNFEISLDPMEYELFIEVKRFLDPQAFNYLVEYLDEIVPLNIWLTYIARVGEPNIRLANCAIYGVVLEMEPYVLTTLGMEVQNYYGIGSYSNAMFEVYPKKE